MRDDSRKRCEIATVLPVNRDVSEGDYARTEDPVVLSNHLLTSERAYEREPLIGSASSIRADIVLCAASRAVGLES